MVCISFGSCSKKFIFLYLISLIISIATIISLINISSIPTIFYYSYKDNESKNFILKAFLSYIGQTFFIFMQLILVKCTFRNKIENIPKNKEKTSAIKLIFNDSSDKMTNKDLINIIIFSIILLFIDISKAYLEIDIKLVLIMPYYVFLLFFIFILSIYFYGIKFYKHQKCSIIFILIFEIIISIIMFLFLEQIVILQDILHLLLEIFVSFLESLFIIYSKGLMEFKFFSPYKATYIFGLINSLLLLIIYIIVLIIPFECNSECSWDYFRESYSCTNYLCNLLFDNIKNLFKGHEPKEIIYMIGLSIFLGCTSLIFNIIINKYTVCHLFLFEQNKEIIQLYLFFHVWGNADEEYKFIFIISIIVLVLEFFAILVFIECIELNCFELNKNTKKNILGREIKDLESNFNESDILSDNEINY